ncbi:TPA: DUF3644 domain-containing protein [Legionella pneumophila]|nr:DUF3644 domain-containing protein [Legionella pneumophila]
MSPRLEKAIMAFKFMQEKEKVNRCFTLEELSSISQWKISTIRTYIKKQWRDFIKLEKKGLYTSNGLLTISQEIFIKIHSQKLKYRAYLYDENEVLLIKARQFALLAISTYNNPYSEFRTYGYIVNIVIAWTALFHAVFQRKKIDFFYKNADGSYQFLDGDKKAWELTTCLEKYWKNDNPLKANIKFLIGLRNKIEHRNLPIIDLKIAGHCQACANNFEEIFIKEFGSEYALNRNIALAIQLGRSQEQKQALKEMQMEYIDPILKYMDHFEEQLPVQFLESPEYRVSYFLAQKISNHKTSADLTIEFVKSDIEPEDQSKVFIKEREKEKFKPKQIVTLMNNEGYKSFNMSHHTNLWKKKNARNSTYGVKLNDGSWYWYTNWVDEVRKYCKQNDL